MAAADQAKSPERLKPPTEEVETSVEEAEAAGSGCSSAPPDEAQAAGRPAGDGGADVGSACGASVSEVSVEFGAGADKTQDRAAAEKMAEAHSGAERAFDWSEAEEDDERAKAVTEECGQSDATESAEEVEQEEHADYTATDGEKPAKEENLHCDAAKDSPAKDLGVDVREDEEEAAVAAAADGVQNVDLSPKQKKFTLECKDCGKKFDSRETFQLHRHFHMHEDELTPLTCKECGLTFQHRSSLIKHRSLHKEREEQLLKEKGRFQCAECQRIFFSTDKLRDHNCSSTVEKPYHCPLCRQDFQFKVSVTKHMSKHMMTRSNNNIFKCQECNQIFPNVTALRFHQKCHPALKPYECPECGMVFKHYSVMEDHRRKHADSSRSHMCSICGKTFKYSSLLHQHQYLHTGQKPFRCPECGKKFAFAQNMKAHCRQHRLRQNNSFCEPLGKQSPVTVRDPVKGAGKENSHQSEEPKRAFNCPLCPQTFSVPANLRAHMLIHEAEYDKLDRSPQPPTENNKVWEKGHTCPHCPSIFREQSSLKFHCLSVHKSAGQSLEVLPTSPQKQLSALSSDGVQEKWKSESAKSHKCDECGKTFRHRSVLELHMRIHSKDKPYQCKVCGKGFRFSSYLQQHLIIHTGKKPYKCPDCGKDFAFLQNMRTHQRLHQEKPFRCTHCRKGYSDETQLQHHMLSHNGDKPHKCELCEKSFGLAYLLRDHMNTHTGERPHRCDECHKTFSWFSSLLVHQKIHSRKKQSFGQMKGRGRRPGRPPWGWSRPVGASETGAAQQQGLYPVSTLRDGELHRGGPQPPLSMLPSRLDLQNRHLKEPWLPEAQPVQWKVDSGEVTPVSASQQQHAQQQFDPAVQTGLQQHRTPGWAEMLTPTGPSSAHSADSRSKESAYPANMSKKPSLSTLGELRQHKPVSWSATPTSAVSAPSTSVQQDFLIPSSSYTDGAALWSIRPAPTATSQISPNKHGQDPQLLRWAGGPGASLKEPSTKKDDRVWDLAGPPVLSSTVTQPDKPWTSGLAGVSTSAQIDQSSSLPISTAPHGVGSTFWEIQSPPGVPKTLNSTEKLLNNQEFQLQQKQVSAGWVNVQPAAQKAPISIPYEPHRFGQPMGSTVWGFQTNPVGPQTLLSGPLKAGGAQELPPQPPPMVTGTQIIINQPSPFFPPPLAPLPPLALPGPHPLHSVALPRPPHPNLFFTPQAVMSERPHMPQALPLPQLAPQTEPHKLGARLPFGPDRLLQCMICGCSLPRELDLQMHYLQHAQGEI